MFNRSHFVACLVALKFYIHRTLLFDTLDYRIPGQSESESYHADAELGLNQDLDSGGQ